VLVDIVKNAEGGKYLELLLLKDMSKNLEKQEVWLKIASLFSQVYTFAVFFLRFRDAKVHLCPFRYRYILERKN
jgi:hypothetical protein